MDRSGLIYFIACICVKVECLPCITLQFWLIQTHTHTHKLPQGPNCYHFTCVLSRTYTLDTIAREYNRDWKKKKKLYFTITCNLQRNWSAICRQKSLFFWEKKNIEVTNKEGYEHLWSVVQCNADNSPIFWGPLKSFLAIMGWSIPQWLCMNVMRLWNV